MLYQYARILLIACFTMTSIFSSATPAFAGDGESVCANALGRLRRGDVTFHKKALFHADLDGARSRSFLGEYGLIGGAEITKAVESVLNDETRAQMGSKNFLPARITKAIKLIGANDGEQSERLIEKVLRRTIEVIEGDQSLSVGEARVMQDAVAGIIKALEELHPVRQFLFIIRGLRLQIDQVLLARAESDLAEVLANKSFREKNAISSSVAALVAGLSTGAALDILSFESGAPVGSVLQHGIRVGIFGVGALTGGVVAWSAFKAIPTREEAWVAQVGTAKIKNLKIDWKSRLQQASEGLSEADLASRENSIKKIIVPLGKFVESLEVACKGGGSCEFTGVQIRFLADAEYQQISHLLEEGVRPFKLEESRFIKEDKNFIESILTELRYEGYYKRGQDSKLHRIAQEMIGFGEQQGRIASEASKEVSEFVQKIEELTSLLGQLSPVEKAQWHDVIDRLPSLKASVAALQLNQKIRQSRVADFLGLGHFIEDLRGTQWIAPAKAIELQGRFLVLLKQISRDE